MPDMDMPGMIMPELHEWGLMAVLLLFVMWAVMMVAMMVPSAAPMILAFLTVNRRRQTTARPLVPVASFSWIPRGLDRVLRRGHAGPVVVAQDRTPVAHDGGDQSGFGRRAAPRGRRLPMDSTQARVLEGLSVASLLSYERMARRYGRCLRHGIAAWFLLPRMLLDADGPTLRDRRHEFVLGRRDCALRNGREDPGAGGTARSRHWRSAGDRWRRAHGPALVGSATLLPKTSNP